MKKLLTLFLLTLSLPSLAQIKEGLWRGELVLHDTISLPFNFSVKGNIATIHNGDERIHATITQKKDSAVISMPVFGTTITVLPDELLLSGEFFNSTRKDQNHISFRALYGDHFRFSDRPEVPKGDITGNWEATFDDEDDDNKTAVGIFKQEGARVTGTFLTATGDYRFLEGELSGNQLSLSAFDGSHAFLFTAELKNGELKNGHFFSGIHYHETWSAHRNDSVKLKDERSFTFLKPGYSKVEFSLPDLNGNQVTLNDPMFKGKAVIIQIMGSWCPNCMDETRFLSEWYNKEKPTDLIIVGIDYERITKEDYVDRKSVV